MAQILEDTNIKALVIGAAGFVGNYLIDCIREELLCDVVATKLSKDNFYREDVEVCNLDIMDKSAIISLMKKYRPQYIFHLAAQSSVAYAWKNPVFTAEVNVNGGFNVIDAIRLLDYKPKVLLVGSGEEYGYIEDSTKLIKESDVVHPGNVYAATKACQNMIATVYSRAYGLDLVMVRAFNHIGPNQTAAFVVSDFCKQVAMIEKGLQQPIIKVGNLDAKRDFTDVRDVVRAYVQIIQFGQGGETYNVGRGKAVAISDLLKMILSRSNIDIEIQVDVARLRPVDVPIIAPDVSKIYAATGWKPLISLESSIDDILNYWRSKSELEIKK